MRHILLVDIGNALALSGVLPSVALNAAYSAQLSARGGRAPYTYTVSAGTLPVGLYLDPATGIIAGTATASGTVSFTVRATDTSGRSVQRSYAITVIGEPAVLTLTGTFAAATVGTAYSSDLTITNGQAPYTLHGGTGLISGTLPDGLALSIVGDKLRLNGVPMTAATNDFTVAVDSSDVQTAMSAQSLAVSDIVYAAWNPFDVSVGTCEFRVGNTSFGGGGGSWVSVRGTAALQGKTYFEIEAASLSNWGSCGGVSDETESVAFGYQPGSSTKSVVIKVPSNSVRGGNATLFDGADVGSPYILRIGIAVDTATRKVWLRSDNGPWWGGGDPASGTAPTYTLGGVGRIFPSAAYQATQYLLLVSNPAKFTGIVPTGFTKGIIDSSPDSTAARSYDLDFGTLSVGQAVVKEMPIGPYPNASNQKITAGTLPQGMSQTLIFDGGAPYSRISGAPMYAGTYTWTEQFTAGPTTAVIIGVHRAVVSP